MQSFKESYLGLIRLGIGHPVSSMPSSVDWPAIQALASQQGLSAIVLDGIEELLRNGWQDLPPQAMMLPWIGEVLQSYEQRYARYRKAIGQMAGFYNTRGLKMMVLKGYSCSLTWPRPEHRPAGDIDIWQFGMQKEADELVAREKGIEVDNSHHHHTVFHWNGFMVENHYDFLNVYHHRSNASMERILKELGHDDSHWVEVEGERVYIPSPNLHALFLLKHAMGHFAAVEINLRHVLDWAFHVEAYREAIDWQWLMGVLKEYGMLQMFHILNAICVEDLGFDPALFPKPLFDSQLKDRVLADILSPEFNEKEPSGLIPRMAFKFRRWRANAWKHRLCYKESMLSAFCSGVWNHLLKPSSV